MSMPINYWTTAPYNDIKAKDLLKEKTTRY